MARNTSRRLTDITYPPSSKPNLHFVEVQHLSQLKLGQSHHGVRKPAEYRQVEFDRRKKIALEDFNTFIVSKEDLILSKLVWATDSHSEMQLRDVSNLLSTGYDETYLARWSEKLGVRSLLQEAQHG